MLPQVTGTAKTFSERKTQNIASTLITEDHLRSMLYKPQNIQYKPWKNIWSPRNPHSPFGDFPKGYLNKTLTSPKLAPIHETSHAKTLTSFSIINFIIIFYRII